MGQQVLVGRDTLIELFRKLNRIVSDGECLSDDYIRCELFPDWMDSIEELCTEASIDMDELDFLLY